MFRVETLTIAKIGAVLTRYLINCLDCHLYYSLHLHSFAGVILVSLSDSQTQLPSPELTALSTRALANHWKPILGDSLALLSAIFYAIYVVLLKVRIRNESRIDMALFFGFVGLFNVLTCWPIGVVLHWTGAEVFELPSTPKEVTAILINVSSSSLLRHYGR